MKKINLLLLASLLFAFVSKAQTTAIDFTLTDCDGSSKTLFPIIDSGNIVVLVYEHQCSSCLTGANNLKTAINNNFASAKNIRIMYLDNGGYSCSSVKTWVSSHNLLTGPCFAYSNTQSSPYGSGMPVIVVTATKSHKVYVIANSVNLPTVTTLKNAIQTAQTDLSTQINSDNSVSRGFSVYPNPATDLTTVYAGNSQNSCVSYTIFNSTGQVVVPQTTISNNRENVEISLKGFESGIYFIRIDSKEGSIVKKLIIK